MEDFIRAAQFQPTVLQQWAQQQSAAEGTDAMEEEQWLLKMAHSLRDSGAVEKGHASEVQETLMELAHLHELLLGPWPTRGTRRPLTLLSRLLKELGTKSERQVHPVEQLVIGLYGWLVLRMKKQAISAETEAAMVGLAQLGERLRQRPFEGVFRGLKTCWTGLSIPLVDVDNSADVLSRRETQGRICIMPSTHLWKPRNCSTFPSSLTTSA